MSDNTVSHHAHVTRTRPVSKDLVRTSTRSRNARVEHFDWPSISRSLYIAKLDRGYDDYVSGRISEEVWTRKSEQWEDERRTTEAELARLWHQNGDAPISGEKILNSRRRPVFFT